MGVGAERKKADADPSLFLASSPAFFASSAAFFTSSTYGTSLDIDFNFSNSSFRQRTSRFSPFSSSAAPDGSSETVLDFFRVAFQATNVTLR
jgi:hypothetical protein